MPVKSKFFTLNRISGHFQGISCTPRAEIGPARTRYVIDSRSPALECQVTKGAHVWSWHKTCKLNDLHLATRRFTQYEYGTQPDSGVNIVARTATVFP